MPSCESGETRRTQSCVGARAVSRIYGGTHGIDCFYAVNTGSLIGAVRYDDVLHYCASTSSSEAAGEVPSCDAGPGSQTCPPAADAAVD